MTNNSIEETDVVITASIGASLVVIFTPVGRNHDPIHIIYQVHLNLSVDLGCCAETRRRVDFNQPGLQLSVNQHVKSIQLEAVFVIYNYILDCL